MGAGYLLLAGFLQAGEMKGSGSKKFVRPVSRVQKNASDLEPQKQLDQQQSFIRLTHAANNYFAQANYLKAEKFARAALKLKPHSQALKEMIAVIQKMKAIDNAVIDFKKS